MTPTPARSPASVLLLAGFGLFVATLVALVAMSLSRRDQPTFAPTVFPRAAGPKVGEMDTITIDARDDDAWRYVSLSRSVVLAPADTAGWELAVRRFRVISWGKASDRGAVPDTKSSGGDDRAGPWVETARGRDTVNAALKSWYRYSMVTHLLESRAHRYAVQRRDGGVITIQVLSYYCPELVAGCLTIRSMPGDLPRSSGSPVSSR